MTELENAWRSPWRHPLWLLLVAAAACYTLHPGLPGYHKSAETYYMGGALEFFETGDWLVPSYKNQARLRKPPLYYWLVALSYHGFGVGIWQARLPSALAGVAAVGVVYALGLVMFQSRRSALYAACALLSSYLAMLYARVALTDAAQMLLVAGAFLGFALACRTGRWRGAALAWACMGAALMVKNPLVALVPLGSVVAWMFPGGRRAGMRWWLVFHPVGTLCLLALVLPWPLLLVHRLGWRVASGGAAQEIARHVQPTFGHLVEGLAFYPQKLFVGLFPWSLLVLVYLRRSAWGAWVGLLAIWVAATAFAFAGVVTMFRSRYILPVMPALALLAGYALDRLQGDEARGAWVRRLFRWGMDLVLLGCGVAGGLLMAAALCVVRTPAAVAVAAATIVLALGFFALVRHLRSRGSAAARPLWGSVGVAALYCLVLRAWPGVCLHCAGYELARQHLRDVPAQDVVGAALSPVDLTWCWMGAGRRFGGSDIPEKGAGYEWDRLASRRPAYILLSDALARAMPPALRQQYAEVDRARQILDQPDLLWFLRPRARVAQWQEGSLTLALPHAK